jgi:hypothetical protein
MQTPSRTPCLLAVGIAALLFAACQTTPRLKDTPLADITAAPERYLSENFGADSILPGPKASVLAQDSQPVQFTRLKLVFNTHTQYVGINSRYFDGVTEITMESDGGPFVRSMEVAKAGGKPTEYVFASSYRNLGTLRAQTFDVAKKSGKPAEWVGNLTRLSFSPSQVAAPQTFDIEMDHRIPLSNGVQTAYGSEHCDPLGAAYSANTIHPALSGRAQDYACVSKARADTDGSLIVYAYLVDEGVFIAKRLEDRSNKILTLTAATVEVTR